MKHAADVTVYVKRHVPKTRRDDPYYSVTLDVSASMRELERLLSTYLTEHFPNVDFSIMAINESPPSGVFWIDVKTQDHHLEIQIEVLLTWFQWSETVWHVMTDSAMVHHQKQNECFVRIRTWHHPKFGWCSVDLDNRSDLIKHCTDRFDAYYRMRRTIESKRSYEHDRKEAAGETNSEKPGA